MLGFTLVALAFDFSLDNACEHESLTRFPLCEQTVAARLPEATALADTTRRKLLHILATPTVTLLRTVQCKTRRRDTNARICGAASKLRPALDGEPSDDRY